MPPIDLNLWATDSAKRAAARERENPRRQLFAYGSAPSSRASTPPGFVTTRHVSALNSVVHADLRAKLIAAQGERDAVEAEALDFNRRVMARVDTLELGLEAAALEKAALADELRRAVTPVAVESGGGEEAAVLKAELEEARASEARLAAQLDELQRAAAKATADRGVFGGAAAAAAEAQSRRRRRRRGGGGDCAAAEAEARSAMVRAKPTRARRGGRKSDWRESAAATPPATRGARVARRGRRRARGAGGGGGGARGARGGRRRGAAARRRAGAGASARSTRAELAAPRRASGARRRRAARRRRREGKAAAAARATSSRAR